MARLIAAKPEHEPQSCAHSSDRFDVQEKCDLSERRDHKQMSRSELESHISKVRKP
ncbi:hypothetical protein OROGR_014845 [Orobanche gracilis]